MAETLPEAHQTTLLRLFERPTDGRLSAGDLKKKLGSGSKKGPAVAPEAVEADRALSGLIGMGLITVAGGAKDGHHPRPNASYRLTEKGRHHLRPARPDMPDEQLQAQEAFILLQVFRAKERKLTRSDLNAKLKTRAAMGQLEFDVKEAPATVDYHLAALVEKGCLDAQRQSNSVGYSLNPEQGAKALAATRQHDGVSFTLNGETLNALLAAARQSKPVQSLPEESPLVDEPATDPAPVSRRLGPHDITKYIDQLRSDKFAGKDLIPIHEVRRLVAEQHSDEAASHPAFDPLIKRMRSEGQLELIAISDNRDATREQLDNSIPGMNETLFYIVVE